MFKLFNMTVRPNPIKMRFFFFLILPTLLLASYGCKKSKTKTVEINLHLADALSRESDNGLPKEILNLIKPVACDGASNAIINLKIHRNDFEPTKVEVIEVPLTMVNDFRKKLNMLAFEHSMTDFTENSSSYPNSPVLFLKPKSKSTAIKEKELAVFEQDVPNLFCCTADKSTGVQVFPDFKTLTKTLRDSICISDHTVYNVVFRDRLINPIEVPESAPELVMAKGSPSIEAVFNSIGNAKIDPKVRFASIENHMHLFADNAHVRVVGEQGTLFEPVPVDEYLEKISLYRSLKNIEIVDALKNESGSYWEIQLKEIHQNF